MKNFENLLVENSFTIHFATINTVSDFSSVPLLATFTIHFATINTIAFLSFSFARFIIYNTLCYY